MPLKLSNTYKTVPIGLEFKIVYRSNGFITIERIRANNYSEAKSICEQRGDFVNCEYIHSNSDLLYIH